VYACQQCRQSNTSQELVVQMSDAYAYASTSKSESSTAGSRLPPWEAFTIYYLFCSMYGSTAELNGLRLRRFHCIAHYRHSVSLACSSCLKPHCQCLQSDPFSYSCNHCSCVSDSSMQLDKIATPLWDN